MKRCLTVSSALLLTISITGCGLKEQFPERAIFIANGNGEGVMVIDPKTAKQVGDIAVDPGFHPQQLSLSADGQKLAIAAPSRDFSKGHDPSKEGGKSKVYIIDADNGDQNGVLDVDATVFNVAFLDDFSTFAIGLMESDQIQGYTIDGLEKQWSAEVGAGPLKVTLVEGDRLVTACSGNGTLSIVDAQSHSFLDSTEVGDLPTALWATPGGLFVSLEGGKSVSILNPGNLTEVTGSYDVGGIPGQVASVKSGGDVWIAVKDRGVIEVRATKTGEIKQTIAIGGRPNGVHIDETDGLVYVTDSERNQVIRIDANTYEVKDQIEVGDTPGGIAQKSF